MTPQELKNSILQLAIQGKLVEQHPEEGTGKELLEKILVAKNAEGAKGREIKRTRSRGVRGGSEDEGIFNLPKAAKSHHGKLSALSASPREDIPDDEKPFDIPESWEWVRLINCGEFISGFTPPSKELCEKGTIPYFKVADMNVIGNELWMQEAKLFLKSTSPKKYFCKNTIVYPKNGGAVFTNKKRILAQDSVVDLNTGGFSASSLIDLQYIYVYFTTIDFRKCYKGTALPTIDMDKLKSRPFPLPPLAEQKRIVAKIEELMPLVERYEKAWSKLKDFNKRFPVDMQKSLLQMAIQGKLVEQRAEEGTGRELLEEILAAKNAEVAKGREIKLTRSRGVRGGSEDEGVSNLPKAAKSHHGKLSASPREEIPDDEKPFDIPESWEWVRVGDVCTNIQYGSSKKSASTGSVPVLRMGNIQNGKIDYSKLVFTSDEDEIRKYTLEGDDLLFNRTNSKELVGKVAIYKGEQPAIYAGYLVRITPVNISADYLNYVMQSQYYWEYCQSVRSDAIGQSNINAEKLKRFVFPLPPLAEQKRIVAKLEELLPLCERLKG